MVTTCEVLFYVKSLVYLFSLHEIRHIDFFLNLHFDFTNTVGFIAQLTVKLMRVHRVNLFTTSGVWKKLMQSEKLSTGSVDNLMKNGTTNFE